MRTSFKKGENSVQLSWYIMVYGFIAVNVYMNGHAFDNKKFVKGHLRVVFYKTEKGNI